MTSVLSKKLSAWMKHHWWWNRRWPHHKASIWKREGPIFLNKNKKKTAMRDSKLSVNNLMFSLLHKILFLRRLWQFHQGPRQCYHHYSQQILLHKILFLSLLWQCHQGPRECYHHYPRQRSHHHPLKAQYQNWLSLNKFQWSMQIPSQLSTK